LAVEVVVGSFLNHGDDARVDAGVLVAVVDLALCDGVVDSVGAEEVAFYKADFAACGVVVDPACGDDFAATLASASACPNGRV
jgi:hypothetical protein